MRITFIAADGRAQVVETRPSFSAMEAAMANGVVGIEAQCYGACNCATCHVYVEGEWLDRLAPPSEQERDLLGALPLAEPRSRLSCQIKLSEALDGLVLHLPVRQGIDE